MIRRPPRSTRTDTLFPYTTLFRSAEARTRSLLRQELFALPRSVDPAPDDPGRAVARGRAVRNRDDDPAAHPVGARAGRASVRGARGVAGARRGQRIAAADVPDRARSEEHTSELQSLMSISYAVFCLKKKSKNKEKDNDS